MDCNALVVRILLYCTMQPVQAKIIGRANSINCKLNRLMDDRPCSFMLPVRSCVRECEYYDPGPSSKITANGLPTKAYVQ
jgi:hypothetical protein